MSDATNEAVLKLYDHIERISLNLHTLLDLHEANKERIAALEAEQAKYYDRGEEAEARGRERHIKNADRIAALEEDATSLRDFVHGLNDRHTSLALKTGPWTNLLGGATAPVAEVSDR